MNMQQVFKMLIQEFSSSYHISVESHLVRHSNSGTGEIKERKQIYVAAGNRKGIFGEAPTWEETLSKFRANWEK